MTTRTKTLALWVLTGLLAVTFVATGGGKVANLAPSPANFARWGFSMTFMHIIGAFEIAGGLALLLPRLAPLAGLGLAVTMVGALRTGIIHHEAMHVALPAVLLVMLLGLVYVRRDFLVFWRPAKK